MHRTLSNPATHTSTQTPSLWYQEWFDKLLPELQTSIDKGIDFAKQ